MWLVLFLSTFAHAACPLVQLGDSAPATIKLEGKQKDCRAASIFRCTQGALRISGDVKSLSTGSHQITAYCVRTIDTRTPGHLVPPTNAEIDEELNGPPARPDFDEEFGAFQSVHDAN